jgi:hypothetical protein
VTCVEDGDPIQVWRTPGHQRVRRWQSGHTSHHASRHVTVGTLPDGRWYADHTETTIGARAYPTEGEAQRAADALMTGGEWRPVPANFGADGQPIEPGWVRYGNEWRRA